MHRLHKSFHIQLKRNATQQLKFSVVWKNRRCLELSEKSVKKPASPTGLVYKVLHKLVVWFVHVQLVALTNHKTSSSFWGPKPATNKNCNYFRACPPTIHFFWSCRDESFFVCLMDVLQLKRQKYSTAVRFIWKKQIKKQKQNKCWHFHPIAGNGLFYLCSLFKDAIMTRHLQPRENARIVRGHRASNRPTSESKISIGTGIIPACRRGSAQAMRLSVDTQQPHL